LSGAFVSLNSILKSYWVPKGFAPTDRDATKSPLGVAKNILVRTMEQAHADQMRADIVRRAKLVDKYEMDWSRIQTIVRRWAAKDGIGKKAYTKILMAIMQSCGPRKIEVLDPNIQYYTLAQWEQKIGYKIEDDAFHFGSDDNALMADLKAWRELLGSDDYIIVQHGVAKDKNQAANAHITMADSAWVENWVVFKVTIILTASEIVKLVAEVRAFFKTSKISDIYGMSRKKLGAKVDTASYSAALKQAYPIAYSKSVLRNWSFGTHMCRRIYAIASVQF
jgi:hypothetical protein